MRTLLVLALLCGAAGSATAQRTVPPRRPQLPRGADTNDARAYADFAESQLRGDPRKAAAGFYWATRLDPLAAELAYAYRVALLLEDSERLRGVMLGERRMLREPEVRQLDSLMDRALRLNPFFHTWLDDILIKEVVMRELRRTLRAGGEVASEAEMTFVVNNYLRSSESGLRPTMEYAQGRFSEALAMWADEARRHPRDAQPRARRARALFLGGNVDSALVELRAALRLARAGDADSLKFWYESKASWEYAMGRVFEQQGRNDSARAAYERTSVEDLSYYPAHLRLGILRLGGGDTLAALRELAQAVEVKEDEYLPRLTYAATLHIAGRRDSAEAHLVRAIEMEPWTPLPRKLLGVVRDEQGNAAGAIQAYEEYLARAPRAELDRAQVQQRIEALRPRR